MGEIVLEGIWPEWEIIRQIGRGSFGTVYKAVRRDYQMENYAAIKVISIPQDETELQALRSEGLDAAGIRTYLQEIVNDFVKEIRVMESLKGVQNIVSVEDYKVVERTQQIGWEIYIRMELLTPFPVYISDKVMDEAEVIRLGCEICTALEICAKRNVIHRDIKPENIFVNDFGYFKLGDFGIARKLESMTSELSQRGTERYMAPEVEKDLTYDASVDFYSLGLVLYQLMNKNRLPFLDTEKRLLSPSDRVMANWRRLEGEALPPPCDATPEFAAVILRACAYDPKDRFESASAMKEALQQAAGKDQHADRSTADQGADGFEPAEKRPGKKKRIAIPIIVVAAAAVLGSGFFYLNGNGTGNLSGVLNSEDELSSDVEELSAEEEEEADTPETTQEDAAAADQTADSEAEEGIDEESVLQMLSSFKDIAYGMLEDNYSEQVIFPFQVIYYGTISKQNALKLAAEAIMETEYPEMEDPGICIYYEGQIVSDQYEVAELQTHSGARTSEMFTVPEGMYEQYMADLFGITESLSDVVTVYDDSIYFNTQYALDEETGDLMISYAGTDAQDAILAFQWGEGQFYIKTGEFSFDSTVTIKSISNEPNSEGAYTVVAGYSWPEGADEGDDPTVYYMSYSVVPSEASAYGCAITGMEPAGYSGLD